MSRRAGLFAFLLLALFLSGCGADLAVKTVVRPDLGGERIYSITVSPSDLEQAGLAPDRLLQILKDDRPKDAPLDIKILNRARETEPFTFVMRETFADQKEMQAHAAALSGGRAHPRLSVTGPPLAPTYRFVDDAPALQYFGWVFQALDRRGLAQESRAEWVNSATSTVVFPDGEESAVAPGLPVERRVDLAAREDLLVRWDPVSGRSDLDLTVDLAPSAARAVKHEDMAAFLSAQVPGSAWTVSDLPDGGRRYRTVVSLGQNFAQAGRYAPTRGLKLERQEAPAAMGLARRANLSVSGEASSWLGTSDVDLVLRVVTGFTTRVSVPPGRPNEELVERQVSVHVPEGPVSLDVTVLYPNLPGIGLAAAAAGGAVLFVTRTKWRRKEGLACSGGFRSSS